MAGERAWQEEVPGRGCAWQGACAAGETATEAGGTNLTGMHSSQKRTRHLFFAVLLASRSIK